MRCSYVKKVIEKDHYATQKKVKRESIQAEERHGRQTSDGFKKNDEELTEVGSRGR